MITKEYARAAYRLIIGREPEDEAVLTRHVLNYDTVAALRHDFFNAQELLSSQAVAGPLYLARVPERYGAERGAYEAAGGLARPGDAADFLANGGEADHPRHYFLALAIDQIVKDGIAGDFAELGVYRGATASLLAATARRAGRVLYLLDTFEGFAERDLAGVDAGRQREYADASAAAVCDLVGDEAVRILAGHFPGTAARLPEAARFSLVHLDCKLYAPCRAGLEYFWPRLAAGGFLVVHDYGGLDWPGVEQAVDEFFADKAEAIVPIADIGGTVAARKHRPPER